MPNSHSSEEHRAEYPGAYRQPKTVKGWTALGRFLTDHHVPSISPEVGMFLARVAEDAAAALAHAMDGEVRQYLLSYVTALTTVASVAVAQQAEVIAALKRYVGGKE